MKRIVAWLLCLCLLLAGCGGQTAGDQSTVDHTTDGTVDNTTDSTVDNTTDTTEDNTTEGPPDPPPVLYRHPLNGSLSETPYTGRATAVVINNIKVCLPLHGIGEADMIYELETEGGITRLLAIFSDFSEVTRLGPVRSNRSFFNSISSAHDAPVIHCGGSEWGLNGYYTDTKLKVPNWAHINEQSNGRYFFRDRDRYNSGYAWEHTLFTSGEKLLQGLKDKGYDKVYEQTRDHGLLFSDDVALTGEAAGKVTVTFNANKTTTMTYDAATGLYNAAQYGQDMTDGNTEKTVTFANVLVLNTKQWQKYDGYYYRSFYTLIGEGEGYLAIDGQIVPIKWSRKSLNEPFVYTYADGSPVSLKAGTTYVGISPKKPGWEA